MYTDWNIFDPTDNTVDYSTELMRAWNYTWLGFAELDMFHVL